MSHAHTNMSDAGFVSRDPPPSLKHMPKETHKSAYVRNKNGAHDINIRNVRTLVLREKIASVCVSKMVTHASIMTGRTCVDVPFHM